MKTLHYFILVILLISPQAGAQNIDAEILMTIHDREVTVGEFERIYKKNNSNTALEQQTVEKYLELFVNFKLKVIEAEERGLDTTQAFLREFNGYKKQLAKPYLSDQEEVDILVKEAFERSQTELHASHIMIRLNEFAGPEDTATAYNNAIDIRNRWIAGEDFSKLATTYSDDPSAKDNGGDLGWFTTFRMVYPFETAAYNTPEGQVSFPVRSRFGYHLIYRMESRPARGEVQVAHIMVMVPESMTDEQKIEAKEKIYQYYDSLQSGEDFKRIATEYSEDRGSAGRGGELPWFGTGRMVAEFENTSFGLQNVGDYSEPVQTFFGWHIIKLLSKKTYDDFDAVKADLQASVTKSDRNTFSRIAMIERIKKKNSFKENPANLEVYYDLVDTSVFVRQWDAAKAANLDGTLFTIGDLIISQAAFTEYIDANQGGTKMNLHVFVFNSYTKFVEEQVLQYEEDHLPEKYPDFRHLVQEYHDGILLFDLTDQMVWSKAVEDTLGLEAFYSDRKDNYRWEKRMDATLFTAKNMDIATFCVNLLNDPKNKRLSSANMHSRAIAEFSDSTCLRFEQRKLEAGDNAQADKMNWDRDKVSEIETLNNSPVFLVNNKILKPGTKKLEECRGLVTADYQNHLEKAWIEELKLKYPVIVNKDLLSKIN
jgi:peptidyl-prolyl cis-trans isomerase SurA